MGGSAFKGTTRPDLFVVCAQFELHTYPRVSSETPSRVPVLTVFRQQSWRTSEREADVFSTSALGTSR
jgi:hypothetical protein